MTNVIKSGIYKRRAQDTQVSEEPITPVPTLFDRIKTQDGKIVDVPRISYIVFLENQLLELKKKTDKQEAQLTKLIAEMRRTQAATRKLDKRIG